RPWVAVLGGGVAALIVLGLWYGLELWHVEKEKRMGRREVPRQAPSEQIRQVLTEVRVVLPGAQAMLGFQLLVVLTDEFGRLSSAEKWIHFAGLFMTLLAVALLVTPAAWPRIVEHGEETTRFHRFAGAMVLAALPPLGLGVVGDLYVILAHL